MTTNWSWSAAYRSWSEAYNDPRYLDETGYGRTPRYCDHPNENPAVCTCHPKCYCNRPGGMHDPGESEAGMSEATERHEVTAYAVCKKCNGFVELPLWVTHEPLCVEEGVIKNARHSAEWRHVGQD